MNADAMLKLAEAMDKLADAINRDAGLRERANRDEKERRKAANAAEKRRVLVDHLRSERQALTGRQLCDNPALLDVYIANARKLCEEAGEPYDQNLDHFVVLARQMLAKPARSFADEGAGAAVDGR